MVVAGSQHRFSAIDCSVVSRAGAIVPGPSSVLLPPDGPNDLPSQLREDSLALLALRQEGETLESATWADVPLDAIADGAQLICRQLAPLRTAGSLLDSYSREAVRGPAVRLAYAMAWLAVEGAGVRRITRRRGGRTNRIRG